MARKATGERGVEAAVVSAATRKPVDVRQALGKARDLAGDAALAAALVDMAYDVDRATVGAFLDALARIDDPTWRARTLFSVFRQTRAALTRGLPARAQDAVVALVQGIGDEPARAAALRHLPPELPARLRARLAGLAEALTDPVLRLQALVHYEPSPSEGRTAEWLAAARGVPGPEARGAALVAIAPRLPPAQLVEAFAAAGAIADPGAAGLAQAGIAAHFADPGERQRAQLEILRGAPSIADPRRRFDVLAALRELPLEAARATGSSLFALATGFQDADLRCRAMFVTADFAEDEILRTRTLLAGIAAAERVADVRRRAELLAVLRPGVSWVDPAVRAEVRRAVDRIADPAIHRELRATLGRFFAYDGPAARAAQPSRAREGAVTPASTRGPEVRWDVFISYATPDLEQARSLAFELRSVGLRVFLGADTIDAEVGSSGWITALDEAIESTRAMLVLVTAAAMASRWVAEEWRKFYRVIVDRQSGTLVSLRLGGPAIAELPLTLRAYQVIDADDGRVQPRHVTRVLDLVRGPGPAAS
jgi:hypothetical protein